VPPHNAKSVKKQKKKGGKICLVATKYLPLHRYPENNLFTLKELIPIED